jgi:hypothetical protein
MMEVDTTCRTLVDAGHQPILHVAQSIRMTPTPSCSVSSDLGSLAPRVLPAEAA